MNSDKNKNFLEKHLKVLGQKIRIDILKKLKNSQNQKSFSKLQKEVLENNNSTVNFSFHLSALKKCDLINSTEHGYFITKLGAQILENILSIERILIDKSKTRMIRTSKYSKELFDTRKIEQYLSTEGGLEAFLARQIAREVEERLAKTNIEYLTAPLMREYINVVLLENGLEEVRHKLTRLGTPPYEVSKLFNLKEVSPDKFINQLGSDVSEQFLLLNLIPKKLADLYLSGEIALLHLNYWSLRPLSIYLNTDTVLENINNYSNISKQLAGTKDHVNLILNFFDFLYQIRQFHSEDVVLGDFNNKFLFKFDTLKENTYLIDLLSSQIIRYNESFQDNQQHLTIDFSSQNDLAEKKLTNNQTNKLFINLLKRNYVDNKGPFFVFGFSDFTQILKRNSIICDLISSPCRKNVVIYNNNYSNLLNSTLIKIDNSISNDIILDKILINLHLISVKANQNDDLFFELLHDKLNSVFELFKFKENLVTKKLNTNKKWLTLSSQIFSESKKNLFQKAIKSISFFGLNTAITNHCGIELDRTENSLRFALAIFTLMRRIIEEQNEKENNRYKLSQPHNGSYLSDSWYNGLSSQERNISCYSSRFIRENSPLTLTKKIDIFRKIESKFNDGIVFNHDLNKNRIHLKEQLKILLDSKINAISFNNYEKN